jgi:hypothetical protein
MTIVVEKIYYCENAWSTFLSIAAFKKFNARFQVGNNFDTIDLLGKNGRLLLQSSFNPVVIVICPFFFSLCVFFPFPLSVSSASYLFITCHAVSSLPESSVCGRIFSSSFHALHNLALR